MQKRGSQSVKNIRTENFYVLCPFCYPDLFESEHLPAFLNIRLHDLIGMLPCI